MNYISNEQIQEWLDKGFSVRSCVAGRIGEVVGISQHGDVLLNSAKKSLGQCVTTFQRGDEVTAMFSTGVVMIVSADYVAD